MKYKVCDIIKIKKIDKEGMIVAIGIDLKSGEKRYQVYVQNEEYSYFCVDEDLEFKTDLDSILEKIVEENSIDGNA